MLADYLATRPRPVRYATQTHPLGRLVQAMLLTPNLYYAPFIRQAVRQSHINHEDTNNTAANWRRVLGGDVNAFLPLIGSLGNAAIPNNPQRMGWGTLQPHITAFPHYLNSAHGHIHDAFTPGSFVDNLVNEHVRGVLPAQGRLMSLLGGPATPAMRHAMNHLYGSGSLDSLHGVYRQTLHDLGAWGPHGPAGDVLGQLFHPAEEAITRRIGAAQTAHLATSGTDTRPDTSVPEDYYAL